MASPCAATVDAVRRALLAKPRRQARVPVTRAVYLRLRASDMQELHDFRGPWQDHNKKHRDTLLLGRAEHAITAPEMAYWVEHVKYDDGYETPDEYGDPNVDWCEDDMEDVRSVAGL